ncbi:MAG: twin-arginine translocation signal domain-containing protein [Desulfarculus sp.]|jgi:branched-chain amino acid transport system substrate-binding protein|nr:MAG: twin-arginine translocation signal domain-containing protein [Desulfarculus sp.]
MEQKKDVTRRGFLKQSATVAGAAALSGLAGNLLGGAPAYAAKGSGPIKIGVVLPFSRAYKVIGDRVVAGLELALAQAGGAFKGRKFEVIKEDSEMNPNVGLTKTRKLVDKDKVDVLVGPVSSAVCVAMRNYANEKKVPMIIPTAGNVELAGNLYSPYVFRSSISHWIFAHPMGYWVKDHLGDEVMVGGANYAAGQHQVWAFTMAFRGKGGKVVGSIYPPLNEKDYAPYLTKLANSGAKIFFGWFAGNDAVNICRQAAQFGLNKKIKMTTTGWFFERNLLMAQKDAALGWHCCFNWAITLDNPVNKEFVKAYDKFTKNDAGVSVSMSSVHGYDAGQMIIQALKKTGGDTKAANIVKALEYMKLDSPRGPVELDVNHELVQPMYIGQIVKSGSGVEAKIIANLGRWTTPYLGARGINSVGQPFIVK